ncbi:uncharacterized protein LOC109508530 [Hippocampus comes]|uniref:uncharacterized protein LOC109508530 n=1 Tax=Hippocampus comes TaxID=109280 RepID=UPI00094E403C|nr:PREDICTED: uncharacterized protein LOC109508530 [Hippocampus comes]
MSAESPTLGPGNDLLPLEKIQHGIKEFFAQRGMFGDDVKGRRTGQNMTYTLKDKDKDAKINNIIKSIVEKSTLDVANLRELITLWDKEERAMSDSFIDESSYGVVTQQKIKQHLKDFFSERLMIAEREEGREAGAASALKIFARTSAMKKARDPDILDVEEEDDTGIFEEEISASSDEQQTHLDDFSQTLESPLSPNSSTGASPTCFIDKAKDLISQVVNPVVNTIDTASKTIVEKMKSTLQKTMGPHHSERETEEGCCVSERESTASLSPASEENWTPNLAAFFSSAASPGTSDRKDERPLDPDILGQVATEETCHAADLLEEAAVSPLRDPETDNQATCAPGNLDDTSELTLFDDPLRISTESLGSTSTASNLDHDMVEILSVGRQDSPERRTPAAPASDGNKSPDALEEKMRLSDEEAPTDLELTEDGIAKRSSPESVNAELALPEDGVEKRYSPEAVDADLESPEDIIAKRVSSEVDDDHGLPEDMLAMTYSPQKVEIEPMTPEDYVQKRSSSETSDADLKWPEDVVIERPSSEAVEDDLNLAGDQVACGHSPVEVVDGDRQWPEDMVRKGSSSEALCADLKSPEDPVATRPSKEAEDADIEWPEDTVENIISLEMVDTDPEWQGALLAKRTSVELVDADPKGEDDPMAKKLSLELEDSYLQWPEDSLAKTSSFELGTNADLDGQDVKVARMSSSEADSDFQGPEDKLAKRHSLELVVNADLEWLEDKITKRSSETAGEDDLKSPEDREAKLPSSESAVDAETQLSEDQEVRKPLVENVVDAALQSFDVKRPSSEADADPQLSEEEEARKRLLEVAVDATLPLFDVKSPSVGTLQDVDAKSPEGRGSVMSFNEAAAEIDTSLSDDMLAKTPSAEAILDLLSVEVKPDRSEDRLSGKSLSPAEVRAVPKWSEDRLSGKSLSPVELRAVSKWSEDRLSGKSLSPAEVGVVTKLSEDKVSRRSSSKSAVDVRKLSESRVSSRSSSQAAVEGRKLSEDRISRRSSSKAAVDAISKLSEDRKSRRSSSRTTVDAVSKLSEDRISRRSSSLAAVDAVSKLSRRSSSKLVGELELKLSKDRLSSKSSSEAVLGIDIKFSEQELSSEETADLEKTSPAQRQTRSSLWKRWKIMRPRRIQPLLEDCPSAIMDCIGAKPAIRPIFKKVKSMWKTHYGRRKSKRVKGKGERKGARPLHANVLDEGAREASASSIISVELPPSDEEEDECTRAKSIQSMEDAHDIHSFFENMFKKEFSKRLEKSLKRGLLDVVNDYVPEKALPSSADKLAKQ